MAEEWKRRREQVELIGQPEPPPVQDIVPGTDILQERAAELYGQGYRRSQIARVLANYIRPDLKGQAQLKAARSRLRRWEATAKFRDMVYQRAVVDIDMSTPAILQGVTRKAIDGRVDAARFLLEVSGRHDPKGDQIPTQVVLAFGNIPRPALPQTVEADEIIDGEVVGED